MVELRGFTFQLKTIDVAAWFSIVNVFCCTVCYTVGGVSVPLWLADLARPVPVLDGLLACVVVDCILRRYLLCPAARDAMERFLVDAGHVLRSGQDSGCQEKNCEG